MMSNSLNAMTVAQLREKLAELGDSPPSKLRKADLIARVQELAGGGGEGGEGGGGRVTEAPGALDETVKSVEQMTVGELKEALKARGLKVGGNKPDLVQRLQVAMSGISSSLTDTPDAAAAKEVSGDVLTVGEMKEEPGQVEKEVEGENEEEEEAAFTQVEAGSFTISADLSAAGVDTGEFDEVMTRAEDDEQEQVRGPRSYTTASSDVRESLQPSPDMIQVFVRGIPFKARPMDLVHFFEDKAGTVTRIEGMFFNGRASGRAWVTFEEPAFAFKALTLDQAEMDGRTIEVYPPDSRPARQALRLVTEGQGQPYSADRRTSTGRFYSLDESGRCIHDHHLVVKKCLTILPRIIIFVHGIAGGIIGRFDSGRFSERQEKSKTLFVGKLPLTCEREDVAQAIDFWAGVENIRMGFRNGEFAGYAHVDFEDADAAEAAMAASGNLEIGGFPVRLDFASDRRAGGSGGGGRGRGQRGRFRGRGGGGSGTRYLDSGTRYRDRSGYGGGGGNWRGGSRGGWANGSGY